MLTRQTRSNLRNTADEGLTSVLGEVIHHEFSHFSVDIVGLLKLISNNFSSDAIVDMIPILTTVLNRLDATHILINDLLANPQPSGDGILALKMSLKAEKF